MNQLRRLAWLLHRRAREADLAEELAAHEAMKREALEARGLSPAEAKGAARREMGNATFMREESRGVWIVPWLESVWQDVGYAVRSLRRQPGFSGVAVLTLASAIGLTTSLFTAFNALVLRRWDVADADRMVNVFSPYCCRREGGAPNGLSIAEVHYFEQHARTMSGFILSRMNSEGELPDEARTSWVSGNYFRVLGVGTALGRGFAPDEDLVPSPQAVTVLSHAYWRTRLAADSNVVGRPVRLEGVPFTVIGVASRGFGGTDATQADAWIPLASVQLLRPDDRWMRNVLRQPDHCCTLVAGRLALGATADAAEAELSALRRRFQPPGAYAEQQRVVLTAFTAAGSAPPRKGPRGSMFLLMLSGVSAVLFLACANVGNLLLARSAARQREIAVRMGLGASRARVVRQLLTEGLLLAGAAGALGVAIAMWLPSQLVGLSNPHPSTLHLTPDATVLCFTLAISALSCILFGLAPALHATRPPGHASVRIPLRTAFLSVQVALCVVLLVASGLLVRGVQRVSGRDLGFAVRDVLVVSPVVPARALDSAATRAFTAALVRSVHELEGAGPIGLSPRLPLENTQNVDYRVPGETEDRRGPSEEVSADYFTVLGVPLVAGRLFEPADDRAAAIVVNQAMARESGGVQGAVGRALVVDGVSRTVIGVVRDANLLNLEDVYPTVYLPLSGRQVPSLLIRSDAEGVAEQIAALVSRLDSRVRTRTTPLSQKLDDRTSGSRFAAGLAGGLGALALLLATVGMFGVFSFWVQQRTQEIGVRMALGARPAQVIRLVFRASSRAVIAGLVIGVVAAVAASRVLRSMLYGLSPLDPVAFAGAIVVLLLAGITAVYGPARRATRVDPILALRAE